MDNAKLAFSLRHNFDAFYWYPEKGISATGLRKGGLWRLDHLIREARFGNEGIRVVLRNMHQVLHERYTEPEGLYSHIKELDRDALLKNQVENGKIVKEWALKSLDDPRWLPDLLHRLLEDENIDWEHNKDRKD
ncbi:hypothetical protein C0995_013294 [Termitomyces sp. Mi166|nr:hypothetical protein C0995_013294 [Termitomyces sp. Mi166\